MTIVESIKCVLENHNNGLTATEIYNEIIRLSLYSFGAKNPVGVVNGELRRHCADLDFPTAHIVKWCKIVGYDGKKIKFALCSSEAQLKKIAPVLKTMNTTEYLPEESIASFWSEHITQIKQQLLENVIGNHPSFFEHLVVELLLKMGYGYDEQAGIVTGGSHDGGIDGIISEDKLGLDLIYIQAKRHGICNKVGRKELQAFIGAMEHINKGVFITTSSFTQEAKNFNLKQQQKSVKLIDGQQLFDYMVKYGIGVEIVKNFNIYKIDSAYFQE